MAGFATGNAGDTAKLTPLERTDAFDNAYATSFYDFDACGDGVAGRIYRNALTERLSQCPFSVDAKKRFQIRSAAQRRKSAEVMAKLIEANGGLPIRLQGMTRTCHEQTESPEYRQFRVQLDAYSAGKIGADTIIPGPCDAAEIAP